MHALNIDSSNLLNKETGACALNVSFDSFKQAEAQPQELEAKELLIGAVAQRSLPYDTFSSASDNTFQYILITPRKNQMDENLDIFSTEYQN